MEKDRMKRVIQFSRARYFFFGFSGLLLVLGIIGFILNHGLNLGVDFRAGVSYQFQVAPASFAVQYSGPDSVVLSLPAGEQAITSPGDIIFTVQSAKDGTKQTYPFRYANYKTVKDLLDAIGAQVPGVTGQLKGDPSVAPTSLLPLPRPVDITHAAATINEVPGKGGVQTSISEMRSLLTSMGIEYDLQAVGAPQNQEFISLIPVADKDNEASFQQDTEKALLKVLEGKYGTGQVILKSTDFVGARMAQSLASQTIWLVFIAVILILLYMMFRFRPWIYAVAAVLGILHDALIMLSFDAVFRVQVDAGTIAAILTILGYSINDTIVNFDRARENVKLMRGSSLRSILDTSVTQTLSRTFITSGATMLTVVALFILTSGTIKNFALNMIVGITEGTYSTFISAFIVIEWTTWRDRRRKSGELQKYGIASEKTVEAAALEAAEEEEEVAAEDVVEQADADQVAVEVGGADLASGEQSAQAADGAEGQGAAAAHDANRPVGNVAAFSGHSGSRKNKKHKRRHH
jgi:preprotein translocase subunit SecF